MKNLIPKFVSFTGHAHTLSEDIVTLYDKLLYLEAKGVGILHPTHLSALLYNLKCAVNFLKEMGINSFSKELEHTNNLLIMKYDELSFALEEDSGFVICRMPKKDFEKLNSQAIEFLKIEKIKNDKKD